MVNNQDPNSPEEDKNDFRFAHLHYPEPENYNLVINFPRMMMAKNESLDFLKKEGLF